MDLVMGRCRRRIGRFGDFTLSFTVIPSDDKTNRNVGRSVDGMATTRISSQTFTNVGYVSLELFEKVSKTYHHASITSKNIHTVIDSCKRIKQLFDTDELFYINDNNDLAIYSADAEKYAVDVNLGNNKRLRIKHAIVTDELDNSLYEGVVIFIQTLSAYGFMTYSEFCAFIHNLEKVDFFTYAEQLITHQMMIQICSDTADKAISDIFDISASLERTKQLHSDVRENNTDETRSDKDQPDNG